MVEKDKRGEGVSSFHCSGDFCVFLKVKLIWIRNQHSCADYHLYGTFNDSSLFQKSRMNRRHNVRSSSVEEIFKSDEVYLWKIKKYVFAKDVLWMIHRI